MAYRLETGETLAEGMRRIARRLIGRVERDLKQLADRDLAIHQSRRTLKKLRALLDLVRPALPERAYREDRDRVREVARLLAGAREAKVMCDTLDLIAACNPAIKATEGFGRLLAVLGAARLEESAGAAPQSDRVFGLLAGARRRLKAYARLDVSLESVARGLSLSYKAGRRAMQQARDSGRGEAFHEWRKHAQRHWRHMQLLEAAWPEETAARAGTARELARLLGEDHDLLVLTSALVGNLREAAGEDTAGAIESAALARQQDLRALALPLGERLYAEPAKRIEQRFRVYWLAAASLRAAEARPADA